MKDTKTEFFKSAKDLSKSQLNFQPKGHSSIKDHIYQVSFIENKLWLLLETTMKAPANPEKRSDITISDEDIIKMMNDADGNIECFEEADKKMFPEKQLMMYLRILKIKEQIISNT